MKATLAVVVANAGASLSDVRLDLQLTNACFNDCWAATGPPGNPLPETEVSKWSSCQVFSLFLGETCFADCLATAARAAKNACLHVCSQSEEQMVSCGTSSIDVEPDTDYLKSHISFDGIDPGLIDSDVLVAKLRTSFSTVLPRAIEATSSVQITKLTTVQKTGGSELKVEYKVVVNADPLLTLQDIASRAQNSLMVRWQRSL